MQIILIRWQALQQLTDVITFKSFSSNLTHLTAADIFLMAVTIIGLGIFFTVQFYFMFVLLPVGCYTG